MVDSVFCAGMLATTSLGHGNSFIEMFHLAFGFLFLCSFFFRVNFDLIRVRVSISCISTIKTYCLRHENNN